MLPTSPLHFAAALITTTIYWKKSSRLNRHKKTCDGKVQLKYLGGTYHVPKTVFEQLEEEDIIVPEEARYFPYHATFDFECSFDQEKAQELKNTDKLNWQSSHVPLTVSVCSNVPGYQARKCFVSNGGPNEFISEFVQYLTKISLKSSSLLREQDDEEDEEIESENEDCAFLDDETEEQEDISFYRRLNVELNSERRQERKQQQDELALYEDVLFGQEQTRDNKVLNGLEEKLNVYLNELPMPGFNSGKYDLNAVKTFLFPYLIETQPIKFTLKTNSNHASQDRFSQAPGHFQLCCARIQL
ncbi:unnamed protein product [Porites lobata]|uniref:Uncharacterized protein n=1 Tax=Porites lobata TaxID=104759 RepID=A0ABN8P6U0_9CNID|nr:unnamed protein product [Porites lobata]